MTVFRAIWCAVNVGGSLVWTAFGASYFFASLDLLDVTPAPQWLIGIAFITAAVAGVRNTFEGGEA